ncbi:MAG: hypothetical protein PF508_09505 [Spirochaeta sp.]|nr:hypothetical protein [Spirochaeta sp.]
MKTNNVRRHSRPVVWGIALIAIASFLFVGCPQPEEDDSVSIPERINALIAGGNNGSYDTLYTHVHPDASQYNQLKDGATWKPPFESGATVELGTLEISGTTVTSTISGNIYNGELTTFTMKQLDKDVWYVLTWKIATTTETVVVQ